MNQNLEEKLAKMMNTTRGANLNDLQELAQVFLDIVKEVKTTLEASVIENTQQIDTKHEEALYALKESELTLQTLITDTQLSATQDTQSLSKRLTDEVSRLEMLMPLVSDLPDMAYVIGLEARINEKIDAVASQITSSIEQNLPQYGKQFRDGLEILQGDERLDIKAVKGVDEAYTASTLHLSDEIINRAIGIVDQRTSFLINKVSDLNRRVDGVDINSGTPIGDNVVGGTAGSVLFVNPTAVLAQDNANFFWDDTNNRLGLGTSSPSGRLHLEGTNNSLALLTLKELATAGSRGTIIDFVNTNNSGTDPAGTLRFYANTSTNISQIEALTGVSGATGLLKFSTNNGAGITERVRIDTTGNVSIGAIAPLAKFHVSGTSPHVILVDSTSATTTFLDMFANSSAALLQLFFSDSSNFLISKQPYANRGTSSGDTQLFNLTSGGFLGLGTTQFTPTNILSFGGNTSRKIWIENSTTDVTGKNLTIAGGSTVAGTSTPDIVGGQLILQAGLGTGTGASTILFQNGTTLGTGLTLQTMTTVGTWLGNGNLGIGVSPTAVLHLKAGTATANTAPLKFNTGTLLTAAEAGAMEFLTDSYYVTTTTNTIRRMVVAGNTGRSVGATAAVGSVATYTLGASDASFEVSANVLITTATTHSFTVTCAYTDEGNTARTATFSFSTVAGVISNAAITNVAGAVPYTGVPLHIRCKASTAITVATTGTFTTVVYNVEGVIKQIA